MSNQYTPAWLASFWEANSEKYPRQVKAHRYIHGLGLSLAEKTGRRLALWSPGYAKAYWKICNDCD